MTYTVDGPLRDVWFCYCEDCRRMTGHHMAASQAETTDVAFTSDTGLKWFSRQPGVSYGFCGTCGSTMFWRADDKEDRLSICAGTLDHPTGLTTIGVLFRTEAADYITAHPDVPSVDYDHPA